MRLIIGGHNIELGSASKIAQTKQVNDLSSINTRQAGFTNKFKIPLTDKNITAMGLLGVVGNTSNAPYERNAAYLYGDSGEAFIYNGFAVIKSTNRNYEVYIYDGNIDIYKSIENKDLSSLDLTELEHNKTTANVVNSFTAGLDYKYIIADYNGKAMYAGGNINIDYLVPSVNIKYLWDKIFSTHGHTYSGSIFNTVDFNNLWMTFPKGVPSSIPEILRYESTDVSFNNIVASGVQNVKESLFLRKGVATTDDLAFTSGDYLFQDFDPGGYRIEMTGTARALRHKLTATTSEELPARFDILLVKNATNDSDDYYFYQVLKSNVGSDTDTGFYDISFNEIVTFTDSSQLYSIVFRVTDDTAPYHNLLSITQDTQINLKISNIGGDIVDFAAALKGFKIKDFLNEVLQRYALTPYKDKYLNSYKFLTLQEVLQGDNIDDWSASNNKFSSRTSESYLNKNYGQVNLFKHKYNDSDASYYDGSIVIDNVNLSDSKTVIASKIYVPEEETNNIFSQNLRVYKIWDKKVKDDGTVEYKDLKNRFYFMRSEFRYLDSSRVIGSEALGSTQSINAASFESFSGLDFENVINDYYRPISDVLNRSRVVLANVFLTESDIVNIDFSRLKYIKELGGYFLLNKVRNFIKKGLTKVELLSVDYIKKSIVLNIDILSIVVVPLEVVPPFDPKANIVFTWDSSLFLDTTITLVYGAVSVSVLNNGIYEALDNVNVPAQEFSSYLYDSIVTSETQIFLL